MRELQTSPQTKHTVSAAEHQVPSKTRTGAFTAYASAASPAQPSGKNEEIFKGGLRKKTNQNKKPPTKKQPTTKPNNIQTNTTSKSINCDFTYTVPHISKVSLKPGQQRRHFTCHVHQPGLPQGSGQQALASTWRPHYTDPLRLFHYLQAVPLPKRGGTAKCSSCVNGFEWWKITPLEYKRVHHRRDYGLKFWQVKDLVQKNQGAISVLFFKF